MQIAGVILKSDSHSASGRGHRWRRGAHALDGDRAPYHGSARHAADFRNDGHGDYFHWLRCRWLRIRNF